MNDSYYDPPDANEPPDEPPDCERRPDCKGYGRMDYGWGFEKGLYTPNVCDEFKVSCGACKQDRSAYGGDVHCSDDCDDSGHGEWDGCHRFVEPDPTAAKDCATCWHLKECH